MEPKNEETERLKLDCAEAYQVIAALAEKAGLFDSKVVTKALDNLTAAANGDPRPHDDLLSFTLSDVNS